MDAELRKQASDLRQRTSSEAADWLMERYPAGSADWGNALLLLDHISLRRIDGRRLAEHYLSRASYASDGPYRLFNKLLGLGGLLEVLEQFRPSDERSAGLLLYHLKPILSEAQTDDERSAASEFISRLS